MGEINLPRYERDALKTIDTFVLDKLVEQCFSEERADALRSLRLEDCGTYVISELRGFEKALIEHRQAKAAKKRAETAHYARRAGSNLVFAVQQMKHRAETEEKEDFLFYVDDRIIQPYGCSNPVTVQVSYRWRTAIEDQWVYGSITFSHHVDLRPDYTIPLPSRKPSAAKQEQERKDKLYREWEHLKRLGLHSVKEYFKTGHDGAKIPKTFQAIIDPYSRGLNNHSAQFWS